MFQSIGVLEAVEKVLRESGNTLPRGILVEKAAAKGGFSPVTVTEVLKYAELEGHVRFNPTTGTVFLP